MITNPYIAQALIDARQQTLLAEAAAHHQRRLARDAARAARAARVAAATTRPKRDRAARARTYRPAFSRWWEALVRRAPAVRER